MNTSTTTRKFVSLGMFIIDEFAFADAAGKPNGRSLSPQESALIHPCSYFVRRSTFFLFFFFLQIGGGGTYATIGARVW